MKLSLSTEWLFFHLWKKNPETNTSCPGVYLADTIIYRWAQPYFWYFTTKDGQILRKTKERIFVDQIAEIYQKGCLLSGVNAVYMKNSEKQKQSNTQEKIEIEYLTKDSFPLFLSQREMALNALLQKFIEPKNNHNSMIKVSWSPQFCLLYRKINVHDISNAKVPLNERLMTFEGAEHFSEQVSIKDSISSPILSADIEQICINIVKHIQDVSGGNIQISRMILFFKVDQKNRLWLLFSSGIKVRQKFINSETVSEKRKEKQERIFSPLFVISKRTPEPFVNNFQPKLKIDLGFVTSKPQDGTCLNCKSTSLPQITKQQKEQGESELYDISISQIVEAYNDGILDEETKIILQKLDSAQPVCHRKRNTNLQEEDENDYYNEESRNIPGIILIVWGKMTHAKYLSYLQNPSWLKLLIKVCLECYLKFTQSSVEPKEIRDMKQLQTDMQQIRSKKPSIKEQLVTLKRITIKNTEDKQMEPIKNGQQQTNHGSQRNQISQQIPSVQYSSQSKRQVRLFQDLYQGNPVQIESALSDRMTPLQITQLTKFHKQKLYPEENNFPSKKANSIYGNRNGLSMPKLQFVSSADSSRTLTSTQQSSKHDFVMQTIKDLRNAFTLEELEFNSFKIA